MKRNKKKESKFKKRKKPKFSDDNFNDHTTFTVGINLKDFKRLSNEEICNVWKHLKTYLTDLKANINSDNCNAINTKVNLYYINYVAEIGIKTILSQNEFSENFYDAINLLPFLFDFISSYEVKDAISSLFEKCWEFQLKCQEEVILKALNFLINQSKISTDHIKRLNNVKSALTLLIEKNKIEDAVQLVHEKSVISTSEGRELISGLFNFGEPCITILHAKIKNALEDESYYLKAYADIYSTAYTKATNTNRNIIKEKCLQDLIFHCLRSKRTLNGRDKLGKNLLVILKYFQSSEDTHFTTIIYNLQKKKIWSHLKAPGCSIRCNAAEMLFLSYPIPPNKKNLKQNKVHLQRLHNAIIELLQDKNEHVCLVAIKGIFKINWNDVPDDIIQKWFKVIIKISRVSIDKRVRLEVLQGLKSVLTNTLLASKIESLLRELKLYIYDNSTEVRIAFLELLLFVTNQSSVKFWNIIALSCILDCVEIRNDSKIFELSMKLLHEKLKFNENVDDIVCDIVRFGFINQGAMRKVLLFSKDSFNNETAFSIAKIIVIKIIEQYKNLEMEEDIKKEIVNDNHCIDILNILLEAAAIILFVKRKDLSDDSYENHCKDIANIVFENVSAVCWFIKYASNSESAILLLSLLPGSKHKNGHIYITVCIEKLMNANSNEDIIFRILDLLIKWNRIHDIFKLLIQLFDLNSSVPERFLGLKIFNILLSDSLIIEKCYHEMIKFWNYLGCIKHLIENQLISNQYNASTDIILVRLFKHYISMINILHKNDDFDATYHFASIVNWALRSIVPKLTESSESEIIAFSAAILKNIFKTSNTLISLLKIIPKLCCDIILLYCKCLVTPNGIVFFDDALSTILVLLNYSQSIFKNNEGGIEDVVVPKLWTVLMIIFIQQKKEILITENNMFQCLRDFLPKLFSVTENPELYMLILFNATVTCLSKELTLHLNRNSLPEYIKQNKFPYVAEELLSIIFNQNDLRKLCFETLYNMILAYNEIDELSVLLIIQSQLQKNNHLLKQMERIILLNATKRRNNSTDTNVNRLIIEAQQNLSQMLEK